MNSDKENDSIQMSSGTSNDYNSIKRVKLDHDCSSDNSLFVDTPLISSSSSSSSSSEVIETKKVEYCHANDIISLVYVNSDSTDFKLQQPTYTHQLFENEDIAMLTKEEAIGVHVLIIIRGSDLSHRIILIGNDLMSNRDIARDIITTDGTIKDNKRLFQYIIECLQPALPNDTEVFHSDIDWNENINIKELLALKLRKYDNNDNNDDNRNDNSLDTLAWGMSSLDMLLPPGSILGEFSLANDERYHLFLATNADEGAGALLKKAECLAMWYIETADGVDFNDTRWEVVNLYKASTRGSKTCYSFVGYMTLFTFRNPFAGAKIRVCQALVLPIYQGQGWGKKMLLQIYNRAKERADTSEVTVEDPAPGFQCMRDAVDIEWALQHKGVIYKDNTKELVDVSDVASKLKITSTQAQFVLNALQFHYIYPNTIDDDETINIFEKDSTSYRSFRLSVKRSFLKYDKDLKSLPKEDMQRELENLYIAYLERFKRVRSIIERFT